MKTLEAYLALLGPPVAATGPADGARAAQAATPAHLRLAPVAAGLLAVQLLSTLVLFGGWACIGEGALSGHFDPGWLAAWALSLLSLVPLEALTTWLRGVLVVGIGGRLKERLMAGALALQADEVRRRGSARLLSEVLESDGIDELLASGGVLAVLALLDVVVTAALFVTLGDGLQFCILVAWTALTVGLMARALLVRLRWSEQRLAQTGHMVEQMIAHRTRVSQQSPAHWHTTSDEALARYVRVSRPLDRYSAAIQSALPRAYVIAAIAGLVPAFLAGRSSLGLLAASLGAILFGANALQRSGTAFVRSAGAHAAWRLVAPLWAAGAARHAAPPAAVPDAGAGLEVRGLRYRPDDAGEAVLREVSFSIAPGERVLLEGASGSGKSTLATILSGSRSPQGGFVLAGGLDRPTLGAVSWARQVAFAPQYHENHVISGTLLFNLLLARPLPHGEADLDAASALCTELGLDELIERMPAGLHQIVGDTGWRLSQGERSRIFLARALLQQAGVVVLDESLAALDPENLQRSLACLRRRAPALILIAHP